jgi:hypothetical protein
MNGMFAAGTGQNIQHVPRVYDKRRRETLPERTSSTERLPKTLPALPTHLETALRPDIEGFGMGWNLAEMQKSRTVLPFKQVPSLVRAGTDPLQSLGQEHTPLPRYSI